MPFGREILAAAEGQQSDDHQRDGAEDEAADELRVGSFAMAVVRSRVRRRFQPAAQQEVAHLRVGAFVPEFPGVALGDHRLGVGIQEDRVVADGEDAGELVSDDGDGGAQAVAQLEDQVVEQPRADGIQPGRRLVEEQDLGIERHGAGEAGALAHAAADLRRDRNPRSRRGRPAPS